MFVCCPQSDWKGGSVAKAIERKKYGELLTLTVAIVMEFKHNAVEYHRSSKLYVVTTGFILIKGTSLDLDVKKQRERINL